MTLIQRSIAAFSILGLAACACTGHGAVSDHNPGAATADVGVTVTPDGPGKYSFKYAGRFADADGNFDFSQEGAKGNVIAIEISIDSAPPGLKFKSQGSDAMWIVEKKSVGDGSPRGAYKGEQFRQFSTSEDGRTLRVTDLNDDGVLYRYALRFDLNGETIQHDPDAQNGQGGGH